jgi:hypothetical protein
MNETGEITADMVLEDTLKAHGIRMGWLPESKKAVLDAMEKYHELKSDSDDSDTAKQGEG